MVLLRLIRREIQSSLGRLLLMAMLAGVSNAGIIAVINAGGEAAASGQVGLRSAIIFILALFIYIRTQNYILATTTMEVETAIHRLRLRLMDFVRNSELLSLEAIGQAEIVAVITKETATLTQSATVLIVAMQASVLIFFTSIYVAYQSLLAFLMSAAIVTMASLVYLARSSQYKTELHESLEAEKVLYDRLADLLDGFKEVRLNRARSDDLFRDVNGVSTTAALMKIKSHVAALKQFTFSQASFYILLGTIVFVVPALSQTLGASMIKTTTALLFIIGGISSVIQSIPMMMTANASAANMAKLEEMLVQVANRTPTDAFVPMRPFTTIELRGATFQHIDRHSEAVFRVGPVDFILHAGEIVFISGGNGSGKSTFLRLLTGLYRLDSGTILVDGRQVGGSDRDSYREQFTAIFSDYHLFKRAYGVRTLDPAEVDRLLALFQLSGKTRLVGGEFTTIDLSAGQRKRLALIVGLLEERPILVLDEWTADQDPEFRRKFYDELLPMLQQSGKTIVAVTHDDRYLNELKFPARKLHMEDGLFSRSPSGSA